MSGEALVAYYGRRAAEYERIYQKPERQEDLDRLAGLMRRFLDGQDVLELACGTGYWTVRLAPVARSIFAIDANADVLALAARKDYPPGKVTLATMDAFDVNGIAGQFTAGLAGFWFSHVSRDRLLPFLRGFHRRLGAGGRVLLFDNRYVAGSSTPITRRDSAGNTYQRRRLDDGSEHEILKNFPTMAELREALEATGATEPEITELSYYWCVTYRVAATG
jgi:SAM-dependent methyltransferase